MFSLADIARLSDKKPDRNLISAISYYVKSGDLIRLTKGLYALKKDYDVRELGNKLRTPSYVSLYTVLQDEGVVFQPYTSVFLVSQRSEVRKINGQEFIYRKTKDSILLNPLGLEVKGEVVVASLERSVLDLIYLKEQHLDNLVKVDWGKMKQLNEEVYQSKKLSKYIKEMRQYVRSETA